MRAERRLERCLRPQRHLRAAKNADEGLGTDREAERPEVEAAHTRLILAVHEGEEHVCAAARHSGRRELGSERVENVRDPGIDFARERERVTDQGARLCVERRDVVGEDHHAAGRHDCRGESL